MENSGFLAIRKQLLNCLRSGRILHEPRKDRENRNLLFTRVVNVEGVIEMVKSCTGGSLSSTPHHAFPQILAHVLKPSGKFKGWYLKFYFIEPNTIFISVHK